MATCLIISINRSQLDLINQYIYQSIISYLPFLIWSFISLSTCILIYHSDQISMFECNSTFFHYHSVFESPLIINAKRGREMYTHIYIHMCVCVCVCVCEDIYKDFRNVFVPVINSFILCASGGVRVCKLD